MATAKRIYRRKLFQHGGSKAIDLPMEDFVKKHSSQEVTIEVRENGIFIYLDPSANLESDPCFHLFIEALIQDAMKNPSQLKNLEEVWGKDWDELLNGVEGGNEI